MNERSPWTVNEREALNDVLKDQQVSIRRLEIELAVVKTKIGFMSGFFGLGGAAVVEGVKYLLTHH